MHAFAVVPVAVVLLSSPALGQASEGNALSDDVIHPPPEPTTPPQLSVDGETPALPGKHERAWEFSASALINVVPDDHDYVTTTFTADWEWLHLEGRYNYEDIDTGSMFAGVNFNFGEELKLDLTPMLGAVTGNTDGIAPGYEITLAYKRVELYTEGEYVFDLNDSSANFFYSWTELTYSPTDWFRAGVAAQRTKIPRRAAKLRSAPWWA